MKKVFIDFEAISIPFSWSAKSPLDLPFALSMLNVETGESFQYTIDFKTVPRYGVYEDIGESIKSQLKIWGITQPLFISWNGGLERKLLSKLFGDDFKEESQYKETHIFSASLSKMSVGYQSIGKYFKISINDIDSELAEKLQRNDFAMTKMSKQDPNILADGAVAALIGAQLYADAYSTTNHPLIKNFEKDKAVELLNKYSLDDVLRMKWIDDNKIEADRRYKILEEIISFKTKVNNKKSKLINIERRMEQCNANNFEELLKAYEQKLQGAKEDSINSMFGDDEFLKEQHADLMKEFESDENNDVKKYQRLIKKTNHFIENDKFNLLTTRDEILDIINKSTSLRDEIASFFNDIENKNEFDYKEIEQNITKWEEKIKALFH